MTFDERMIALSVQLVQSGRRNIDEVPEHLRDAVQAKLNAAVQTVEVG